MGTDNYILDNYVRDEYGLYVSKCFLSKSERQSHVNLKHKVNAL